MPRSLARVWLGVALNALVLALVYYGSARIGLLLSVGHSNVTPVWPPSGIAVAALLVLGRRYWPVLFATAFFLNVTTGLSGPIALGFAIGNTLEYVVAVSLLRRFGFSDRMNRLSDVGLLVGLGCILSPMVAATVGTLSLFLGGALPAGAARTVWSAYLVGDGMGILTIAPFILAWQRIPRFSTRALAEVAAVSLIIVGTASLILAGKIQFAPLSLLFPPAIWAAARFHQRGATFATVIIAAVGVWRTVQGFGPFAQGSPVTQLESLQVYLALFDLTLLALAAAMLGQRDAIADRERAERALQTTNLELQRLYQHEQRIATRFQEASLPRRFPDVSGVAFHKYYEPGKNESLVGGDWYDAIVRPDGKVIVSIGDVSGSGLDAAIMMTSIRQMIRGTGLVLPDPLAMLDAADKLMRTDYPDSVATSFVGVIEPGGRALIYASAGHPPALVRAPDGSVHELPYRGILLGLRDDAADHPGVVTLEPGSHVILYTDGLVESTRDYREGERRLLEALGDPRVFAAKNIAKAIYDRVLHDGARDDVAVLVLAVGA